MAADRRQCGRPRHKLLEVRQSTQTSFCIFASKIERTHLDHHKGQACWERLTGRTSCIQVLSPDTTEADQLLNSKLPDENHDLQACSALLEKLAYLPLAITQAAAFMTENNVSLFDYMDVLEAHDDLELVHFLNEDSGDIRRDYSWKQELSHDDMENLI